MTREAFENAMAVVMALGGSTNAVLHLIAMARSVDVPLTIDDFQKTSDRVPYLADLRPSGKYVQEDLHQVGGTPAVMKLLLDEGLLTRRLPNDHRQNHCREPGGVAGAFQGAGCGSPGVQPDQKDRAHSDHARQLLPGWGGRKDHRQGRLAVHRHRELLRLRRGNAGRHAAAESQKGRRGHHPLRRATRWAWDAGDAFADGLRSWVPASLRMWH